MKSSILLTINLKGVLGAPVSQKSLVKNSVNVAPIGSKSPEIETRIIRHNNREVLPCVRKMTISEDIVNSWVKNECPFWEKKGSWATKNADARIASHLNRYDEGYGISFSFLED